MLGRDIIVRALRKLIREYGAIVRERSLDSRAREKMKKPGMQ